MSDLFDLPFEEEDEEPEQPAGSRQQPARVSRPAEQPAVVSRPTDDSRVPAVRHVYTVTELTVRVRDLLEEQFFEIWIEGELSNCKIWNTGHLYFTLKDSSSQLRGFMFRSALRYLKFKP